MADAVAEAAEVADAATSATRTAPILVVGAGPVGLCAALALHRFGQPVRVIDARPEAQLGNDPRAIALSHGSRLIFERLGVWSDVAAPSANQSNANQSSANQAAAQSAATPIRHIHVSQAGGFGQTRIEAAEYNLDALGYVTPLGPMVKALVGAVLRAGIEIRFETAHDRTRDVAPLTLIAEGKPANAEGKPARGVERKEYGQTAIVTEAWSATPHDHQACERFTPEGPLALLPLGASEAGGYSIVWCMRDEHARALLDKTDAEFIAALNAATSFAQRTWTRIAPRAAYPLMLVRAAAAASAREIAIGNAAQTLHPVAGQGLNLGLRDAFELADALKHGISASALDAWRKQRARDRSAVINLTDQYVSLFSNDLAPVRAVRGMGLALFNLLPGARRQIARRMMFGLR